VSDSQAGSGKCTLRMASRRMAEGARELLLLLLECIRRRVKIVDKRPSESCNPCCSGDTFHLTRGKFKKGQRARRPKAASAEPD